jgi:signal transduction histidine kinase
MGSRGLPGAPRWLARTRWRAPGRSDPPGRVAGGWRHAQPADELAGVPLMAAMLGVMMFGVMMWHAHRTFAADAGRARVSEENARLLATRRRFLREASHQLRTPIAIALGHAKLLARDLAGRQAQRDIRVVVGEFTRLKSLGERLLIIAASENPDFLRPQPVALDSFGMEALRRWRPAAQRLWQLGRLDAATVQAPRAPGPGDGRAAGERRPAHRAR